VPDPFFIEQAVPPVLVCARVGATEATAEATTRASAGPIGSRRRPAFRHADSVFSPLRYASPARGTLLVERVL
jgi:hypothetical protein